MSIITANDVKIYHDSFSYNGVDYRFEIENLFPNYFSCRVYDKNKEYGKNEEAVFINASLIPLPKPYYIVNYKVDENTMVFEIEEFGGIPPEKQEAKTKKLGRFVLCKFVNIILSKLKIKDIDILLGAAPTKKLVEYYQNEFNFKVVNPASLEAILFYEEGVVPLKQKFSLLKKRCSEHYNNNYSYFNVQNNSPMMVRPKRKCAHNSTQYNKK